MTELSNDPRKNPGIKRAYYPLPEENPDGWRCVEVHIPDGDEYMELLRTTLKSLTLWYNYARDISHRGKIIADRFAYALQLPELGCDMNCEELMACLAPMFEQLTQIQEVVDTMSEKIEAIEEAISANAAKLPAGLPSLADCLAVYPGALALVKEMHKNNQKYYTEAETSFVDNASEALSIVLELFPKFQGQSYDEAFELGNAYFENQVTAYDLAYPDFEPLAACDLMRRVLLSGGSLTIDVWGDWLFNLTTLIPSNAAAAVFTKYSPLRQTFLNQIAEFFNQEQSLKSYFDDLFQVYFAGTEAPVEELPEGCECLDLYCISLTAGADLNTIFTPFPVPGVGDQAVWSGTGYAANPAIAGRITINGDFGEVLNLYRIEVLATVAVTAGADNYQNLAETGDTLNLYQPAELVATFDFDLQDMQTIFLDRVPTASNALSPACPGEIYEIRIYGNGVPPDFGTPC